MLGVDSSDVKVEIGFGALSAKPLGAGDLLQFKNGRCAARSHNGRHGSASTYFDTAQQG
jgi:hypothetical protein